MDKMTDALRDKLTKHGMRTEVARKLGMTPQAVWAWKRVPAERAQAVSEITGLPLHEIRPDLWPAPAEPAEAGR